LNHLEQLVRFISQDNPAAATRLGNLIIEKALRLSTFPRLGKVFHKAGREALREISVRPYRMFYEINDTRKQIEIVSIWHGARQEPEIK